MPSNEEFEFIRNLIPNRIDMRSKNESRTVRFLKNRNMLAENAVVISNGETEIELSYKIIKEGSKKFTFCQNILREIPNILQIQDFLVFEENCQNSKISGKNIFVEMFINENNGNVYDLFFVGLKFLFECDRFCNYEDFEFQENNKKLQKYEFKKQKISNTGIDESLGVLMSSSYAIFPQNYFFDPSLIEEQAADGVLHVLKRKNKFESIYYETKYLANDKDDMMSKLGQILEEVG